MISVSDNDLKQAVAYLRQYSEILKSSTKPKAQNTRRMARRLAEKWASKITQKENTK